MRTVREFVEDCISDGRPPELIIAVAQNTYWVNKLDKVRKMIVKVTTRVAKKNVAKK